MTNGRLFAGFSPADAPREILLAARACQKFCVKTGDLLRLDACHHHDQLAVMMFSEDGTRLEALHELLPLQPLNQEAFDSAALTGWLAAQTGQNAALSAATLHGVICGLMDEPLIIKARADMTLWLVHLAKREDVISGNDTSGGAISIEHQPVQGRLVLPDPLTDIKADIKEEFTIKAGTAAAYELQKGAFVQIIDAEGQQCSDFQAFRMAGLAAGIESLIDSTATRSMVRSAFPKPGLFDKYYDAEMRPLLRVAQDTCGRHDTFGLACTARSYEERGYPGHLNCSDNMSFALAPYGVKARAGWPAINLFWNTWLDDHHQIQTEEAHSRAGDYVVMEALDDMVCASTACPDDIDPINGWNPTDIHIRIYHPHSKIRSAVAYRRKENAPMQVSQPSPFQERLAPLTNHFAPARDMWAAVSFPATGTIGEYWACRDAATLQDMSGLRKFDIIGPDALRLLQLAMTRDIAKLAVWRGTYSLLCDLAGQVIDDGTLFRLSDQLFRWFCGSEESGRWLAALAEEHNLQVRIHDLGDALPNLALQGPKSRDILRKIAFTQPHVPELDQLKWFGATVARLHDREGVPFLITRTGYTGELGYELFCAKSDALLLWDAVMDAGKDDGLVPMGSAALEILRLEAGLASQAEFAPGADAFEAGLGFAVDLKKSDFVGKQALERNSKEERKRLAGLVCAVDDVPAHGAPVFAGERQIGVVTSATHSPQFECAIAIARLSVEYAEAGTILEIGQLDGRMKRLQAKVTNIPFYDPKRERARA